MANPTANIAIGIGANLGDAKTTVIRTIQTLGDHDAFTHIHASSLYRSEPIDSTGPDYINAAVTAQTKLTPEQTLMALQAIENASGRERPYTNAPRTLDLDLLLYDSVQMNSATLTLPHPRMHLRAFVLIPLAQIDSNIKIPGRGEISNLLKTLTDQVIEVVQ